MFAFARTEGAMRNQENRSRAVSPASAQRFNRGFFAIILFAIASYSAGLVVLERMGMLPPPPLTATLCIDEKFKFLAERDLENVDLIGVGSSVTWRNLEMSAFEKTGLAREPLNAAPCFLHVSEMVSYTAFLLNYMPNISTVVSVMAPRDFAECAAPREDFFSHALAASYLLGLPPIPIYLANRSQAKFLRDAIQIERMRTDPLVPFTMVMDNYGSGPLRKADTFLPKPMLVDECFQALTELERLVASAGATLIVASFPLQPDWHALYDPNKTLIAAFEERIRTSLRLPSTVFISSSETNTEGLLHADAVHYTWDAAVQYSSQLAGNIAAKSVRASRVDQAKQARGFGALRKSGYGENLPSPTVAENGTNRRIDGIATDRCSTSALFS